MKCYMRRDLCYCDLVSPIPTTTKVVVVMHRFEEHKSTNTVRLMKSLLPDTKVHMFGGREDFLDPTDLENPPGSQMLLFPSPNAPVLDAELAKTFVAPVTLVIPDGTWQQAKRLANNRLLCLRDMPKVRIPAGAPSAYRLRKRQAEDGLCTLEALARALGVIEGPAVQQHLEASLEMMVERVLWSRFSGSAYCAETAARMRGEGTVEKTARTGSN